MKRLLCIVGGMNAGGAETFLMKLYRALDKSEYQMDFATAVDGVYDSEIRSLGGQIYRIPPKSKSPMQNFNAIRELVQQHGYQYVLRVSQHSLSSLELLAAKRGGAKVLAFRSSNSRTMGGVPAEILHKIFMPLVQNVPNVKIAPSTEAAEFMFGKNCVAQQGVLLLKNGLNTQAFRFQMEKREKARTILGLDGKYVIGHVGRFSRQKNHDFLLDIFYEWKKQEKDSALVLVGEGELRESIEHKVQKSGLADSVVFAGVRNDIAELLAAFDCFVFPSFYEGMPNTVIEAQTSGLPCLISDTITKEAKITDLVTYLPLSASAREWAQAIALQRQRGTVERERYADIVRSAHYDIADCTRLFTEKIFQQE